MEPERLYKLLEQVRDGTLPIEDAMTSLRSLPFEDLGFAKLDHHRALRTGFPEVVYCPGKTTEHILAILEKLIARSPKILASRATPEVAQAVRRAFPSAIYHETARMLVVPGDVEGERQKANGERGKQGTGNREENTQYPIPEHLNTPTPEHPVNLATYETYKPTKPILVLAAGTADLPVAEEAAVTASEMGSPVETLYDVGVAGLHRLLAHQDKLFAANVLIVVAGMEGALPSVVGGLVSRPVIAVPTSVGYGASFGGLAALLTMLNSCASGIGVVNIDNGFGAGYLAHLINLGNRE
jgi:pyridinium-3,5-biscarboxylic acid mononucleotide synthase